jgi:hypothetical protein
VLEECSLLSQFIGHQVCQEMTNYGAREVTHMLIDLLLPTVSNLATFVWTTQKRPRPLSDTIRLKLEASVYIGIFYYVIFFHCSVSEIIH